MRRDNPAGDSGLAETFLNRQRRYTSREVAAMAGVPVYRARRLWRALGFANVPDDAVEFTEADVEALKTMVGMVSAGAYDDEHLLLMTRSLGGYTARLAESQAELGSEALASAGVPLARRGAAWRGRAEWVVPELEKLLVYAWRRHLASAAGRLVDQESSAVRLAVGFADLVGFTRLSRQIPENDLARLVERFEGRSADVVASSGGRLVKTLGDSVLFVTDTAHESAEIGLRLLEVHARTRGMPGLRVGLAIGQVIGRMGDVYGAPVNLASRLTALAAAGSVLADPALAEALAGDAAFTLNPGEPVAVRGVGEVTPSVVTRRSPT
ncbi:adenylate/guanylate cyclase domain-containing protein [Spongiactinospora sp. TRM90649]|uniref:adenylate/guanylate cyclase domain-containing protein n=1 Tax=Spongiactinospora sp. TRM90649 TaxID=3031114 RepID=UPI0023F6FFD2|nr:adenylate/guanylate cyclase domain-containing protein [Spongiactinospora sp. TRM90649]MDF5752049.1 adenylate/guanylate cyclase domain-containing protein [Spongiactinospora sp. TRM90649]